MQDTTKSAGPPAETAALGHLEKPPGADGGGLLR